MGENLEVAITLKNKNKIGELILAFKTYHEVTVIKTVCYLHTVRHLDWWNRICGNRYTHGQLLFNKGVS